MSNTDTHANSKSHDLTLVQSAAYAIGFRKMKGKDKHHQQQQQHTHKASDERHEPLLTQQHRHGSGDSDGGDGNDHDKKNLYCNWGKDWKAVKDLILGSYINLLLVAVPFGFISNYLEWRPTVVFFLNFFGMIPLASILGDSTECLADHLGETIGGLLNATFGNAVELVVMILALSKAKHFDNSNDIDKRDTMITVVQFSLIGSVFSNSLLVLGCSFLAHGFKEDAQFSVAATSANVSLLMMASFVMVLPAPYTGKSRSDELLVSRVAAIVLLVMYSCLLVYVMYTHKDLMEAAEESRSRANSKAIEYKPSVEVVVSNTDNEVEMTSSYGNHAVSKQNEEDGDRKDGNNDDEEEDDDLEMSLIGSMMLLFVSTTLVALLSEYLVGAIEPMSAHAGITEAFIGLILVPIIGNAVEHITAIRMARKGKMDISLSIAIGSATQVAMFVVGLAVIVGWILDIPMTLDFPQFELLLFVYTSIIVFALVSNGSSNWLKGAMLLCLYVLIAVAVYHQEIEHSTE